MECARTSDRFYPVKCTHRAKRETDTTQHFANLFSICGSFGKFKILLVSPFMLSVLI